MSAKELVEASLITDVTKRNFHALMETAKTAEITKETIHQDYELFKSLIEVYSYLKERMEADNKPEKKIISERKEAYDIYLKPLAELFDKFEPHFIRINAELKKEDKTKLDAIKRQNEILSRHKEFIKSVVDSVIIADNVKELAKIQMLVGTEKSKFSFYGDYKSKIDVTCDILLELIDGRKALLNERTKLTKEMNKWEEKGDITMVTDLKEKIELNEYTFSENINSIAEKAYNEVKQIVLVSENMDNSAIEGRLHRWAYRVDDPVLLYKKQPELITLEGNTKAINAFMAEKKDSLDKDKEHDFNGLVIYYKPFYVQPPK